LGDELVRTGFSADPRYVDSPKAYFEAHIEQGPIMERAGVSIGVVTLVQGITWIDVTVTGMESHAGTTPMSVRKDAMAGAAAMISQFIAHCANAEPDVRVTVGRLTCYPNSPSTIPGKVTFTVDLRHPRKDVLLRMQHAIADICKSVASQVNVLVDVGITASYDPVEFDPQCVGQVRNAAVKLGFSHMDIVSGAGHDAVYVSHMAPAAMIFVPCKDGISHNDVEYARPDHLAMGASVLANVVLEQAGD
jgi:N-carbamoyl-L-amino-acid hydrolase